MRLVQLCLGLGLALFVAACGFQLRGAYVLPYESLYISLPQGSVVGANLKRQIRAAGGTRLADQQSEAQATFVQTNEQRERLILSLNSAGQVRELRLRFRFSYRIIDAKGRELVPNTGIELTRDLTYDDSAVLSKEQEEQLLWRDMENDLGQQLMRRLAAVKPSVVAQDDR